MARKTKSSFLSLDGMREPVNQWLSIAFIGLLCFWTVLYYVTQKAQIIADTYASAGDYSIGQQY